MVDIPTNMESWHLDIIKSLYDLVKQHNFFEAEDYMTGFVEEIEEAIKEREFELQPDLRTRYDAIMFEMEDSETPVEVKANLNQERSQIRATLDGLLATDDSRRALGDMLSLANRELENTKKADDATEVVSILAEWKRMLTEAGIFVRE